MKRTAAACLVLILAGSLHGQSLVELSQRERARRESFKGRTPKAVTNADLAKVKTLPAVTVSQDAAANPAMPNSAGWTPTELPRQDVTPAVAPDGPPMYAPEATASFTPAASLESRVKAAHDEVERLTAQMNQLLQQMNNLNNMTPQDVVRQRIDETYQKLVAAQADEAKLKNDLAAVQANPPAKH
jgi:Asp-tRNA(Asn)/Glu-tRNA(Gln) amidotransferase C subunit